MGLGINIRTIPHHEQRYDTVGDWWIGPDGIWQIRVSKMNNWKYELLVTVHELVEMGLCMWDGVTSSQIDEFDMNYTGPCDEPGDDPKAPYQRQHYIASGIERMLAPCLGVNWSDYADTVDAL